MILASRTSIGERETLMQVIGVVATASLVNSNKFVLGQVNFPAKSAALSFLHNICTFLWMRLSSNCTGVKRHDIPWTWLLCITGIGSLSVVASNLLLQLTSIKFHQLSKLAALPAGAVVDFYLYGKRRSYYDFAGLACVTYGIYVTSRDEMSVSIQPACVALVFIAGYLANAVFVRRLCTQHEITSTQVLYLCVPWGVFSSLVLFLMALSFEPQNSVAEISFEFNLMEASASASANLLLAVSVQWLSTWAASKSTTMVYAIIGQAKTAATIILGVFIFQDSISPRGVCALSMCLTASLSLAASEAFEKEGHVPRENSVSFVGKRLVAILLVATLLMDSLNVGGNPVTFGPAQIVSEKHAKVAAEHQTGSTSFVTFAFTDGAGGRWGKESCRKALTLQYSSLAKSQSEIPHLVVYTDYPGILPERTFSGLKTNITAIITTPREFQSNEYRDLDPWKFVSRAKLDAVEAVARKTGHKVIWIDLDTLVFTDLIRITKIHSWVLGYQHGKCREGNCSAEHIRNGGSFDRSLDASFDANGDLWSLNMSAIQTIRAYESHHLSVGLPLPEYDLQGFFTLMLQDSALPAELLHTLLHFNFGFACSKYQHPTAGNMELLVKANKLTCPVGDLTAVFSETVGSMSFTAPSFQELFLGSDFLELCWVQDHAARTWLYSWFLDP